MFFQLIPGYKQTFTAITSWCIDIHNRMIDVDIHVLQCHEVFTVKMCLYHRIS